MSQLPGSLAQPSADYELLTDLSMLSDEHETWPTFIRKYPSLVKQSYILMAEGGGSGSKTETRNFYHWEEAGKVLPLVQVGTGDTGVAAGDPVTVTLTAGSHTTGGSRSPVAVTYVYRNLTNGQVYRISAVDKSTPNAHEATLDITDDAAIASIAAGDYLAYMGRTLVEEASDRADSLFQEREKITGQVRTIRDDMTFTDRVEYEWIQNPAGGHYYSADQLNNVLVPRFIGVQEMDLMLGVSANNLGANNSDGQGLVERIVDGGYSVPNSGAIDKPFFAAAKRYIEAEGYSNRYDWLQSTDLHIDVDDFMASNFANGAIIYQGPEQAGRPMEIQQNFRSYNVYGITYDFMDYYYFNPHKSHGLPLGVTPYRSKFGIMIPQGDAPDAETGAPVRRFGVRWQGKTSPVYAYSTGGLSPVNKTTKQEVVYTHVANKGLQVFGINGFLFTEL